MQRRRKRPASKKSHRHYALYKETARGLVHARVKHLNAYYQVPIKKIFIKNSRSRWGSCSTLGNLNFNYRVVLLPPALVDYVIVHELCHLREFNHSPKFWELVAQTLPEHKILRKQLMKILLR